ncbi:uncharacterized protein METZ01_LOCUS180287 [marine metagenome]|uniref:Uncharacterized protein n=1 Tax=marine metagenome TaxID=408172 RepID=A0A382CQ71_9ZZZZ
MKMIYTRTIGVHDSKLGEAMEIAKEQAAITKEYSGNDVHVSFQIGGNPRTIRWTTIGDLMNGNAMELDAKISADQRMVESMKKMEGVFVEGTIQDEMRVVFN